MDSTDSTRPLSEPRIIFECNDSATALSKFAGVKFDLIITSPPYNIGKEYEVIKPIPDYLAEQEAIIDSLISMLNDSGSVCWQVGNLVDAKTKEVYPLDIFYYTIFKAKGLHLRNRIVWHFEHGLHASNRFSGRYETILWFTKHNDGYVFNLDDVRVPSKYPGKKHFKGPNRGKYSGNPLGKNPSDVWEIVLQDWEKEVWEIPNVKANHREKTEHPCQYPIELVERCILALTPEGGWVLDPFAGVGTSLLAAYLHSRNAVGIELHQRYVDIGLERLGLLREGRLPYRDLTQPIYDHTQSKLSVPPEGYRSHEGV